MGTLTAAWTERATYGLDDAAKHVQDRDTGGSIEFVGEPVLRR